MDPAKRTRLVAESLAQTDPDLAAVVKVWPELPEPVRAGIVAMVQAAKR